VLQEPAFERVSVAVGVTLAVEKDQRCAASETWKRTSVPVVIANGCLEITLAHSKQSRVVGLNPGTRVSGSGHLEDRVDYVLATRFRLSLVCLLQIRFEHLNRHARSPFGAC
jgi:hypothetical protein